MPKEADNPYLVTESAEFAWTKEEFVLQKDKILCGSLLKLPPICLQTGTTEDVVVYQPRIMIRCSWLWKLRLATGVLAVLPIAVNVAGLIVLDTGSMKVRFPLFMIVAGHIALVAAIGPMAFLAPSVKIHAYVGRKQRRSFGTKVLMKLLTGLPLWFLIFGPVLTSTFSIAALAFSDSMMPLLLVIGAFAAGQVLGRLLDWHWRGTRDVGLNFRAETLNNGRFLVSGFSPEFLNALRRKPGDNFDQNRDHALS